MTRYSKSGSLFLPTTGQSRTVRFGTLNVWAEEGLVIYACNETGKSGQMRPSQAERRFAKVMQMFGSSSDPGIERDAQERREMQRVAEGLEKVIQQAREQMPEEIFGVKPGTKPKMSVKTIHGG